MENLSKLQMELYSRVYAGTDVLAEKILGLGFFSCLVRIVFKTADQNKHKPPFYIIFLTPDGTPLGVMGSSERDDLAIPVNSLDWVMSTKWEIVSEIYVPVNDVGTIKGKTLATNE